MTRTTRHMILRWQFREIVDSIYIYWKHHVTLWNWSWTSNEICQIYTLVCSSSYPIEWGRTRDSPLPQSGSGIEGVSWHMVLAGINHVAVSALIFCDQRASLVKIAFFKLKNKMHTIIRAACIFKGTNNPKTSRMCFDNKSTLFDA